MVRKVLTIDNAHQIADKFRTETMLIHGDIGDLTSQTMKLDSTLQMTNRRMSAKLWRNNAKTYKRHRK